MKMLNVVLVLSIAFVLSACSVLPDEQVEKSKNDVKTQTISVNEIAKANLELIPLEFGKTSVKRFVEVFGEPVKQIKIEKDYVMFAFLSNRVNLVEIDNKNYLAVLADNSPDIAKREPKALFTFVEKINNQWVVQAISLRETEANPLAS